MRRFPPLSASIGVATSERREMEHPSQVVAIATELKEYAKRTPGSSWEVDRRREEPEPDKESDAAN